MKQRPRATESHRRMRCRGSRAALETGGHCLSAEQERGGQQVVATALSVSCTLTPSHQCEGLPNSTQIVLRCNPSLEHALNKLCACVPHRIWRFERRLRFLSYWSLSAEPWKIPFQHGK
eukprot:168655-Chlamydomonas_euryale.AAC.9